MYRRPWLIVVAAMFVLIAPRSSSAEFLATYVLSPPKNADFLLMGGLAVPLVKVDRLGIGVGFNVGGIWDKSDPSRRGQRHGHLTWMPTIPVTFRLGDSWGIAAGLGYGFVKKSAKPHLSNYKTAFVGLAFGLAP